MEWSRGKAYSQDLRDRVFACFDAGRGVNAVAAALLVSPSYVSKVLSRRRLTGETAARPQCNHVPPALTAEHHEIVRGRVREYPDGTLDELTAWLPGALGTTVSRTLVWETVAKLGLTLKKRPCTPPNRCAPTSPPPGPPGRRRPPASTRPG